MDSKYAIKVNGQFLTNVIGKENITLGEVTAFVKTLEPMFDETIDTLEVECLDVEAKILSLPSVVPFAIELHIDNLIATYGADMVLVVLDKKLGRVA